MGGAPKDRPSCFTSGFIHSVESRSPGRRTPGERLGGLNPMVSLESKQVP